MTAETHVPEDDASTHPTAGVPANEPSLEHQREAYDFLLRLRSISTVPWVTYLFVAVNVVVYVANVACGLDFLSPAADRLVDWGAEYGPRTLDGEWWRMLSSAFLHAGIVHVAVNMYALLVVGPLAERLFGHTGFVVLYTFTAITGAIASLWWNPTAIGVGASGAVCGVIGSLLGVALSRNDTIPARFLTALRRSVTNVLLVNLAIGIAFPFIDNAAHIGGFVGGAFAGFLLSRPIEVRRRHNLSVRDLAVLAACVVVSAPLFLILPDPPSDYVSMHAEFVETEEDVVNRANELERELREGTISRDEFLRLWNRDVEEVWAVVVERLSAARGLVGEVAERHALFLTLAQLRLEELELSSKLNDPANTLVDKAEIARRLERIRERMIEETRTAEP